MKVTALHHQHGLDAVQIETVVTDARNDFVTTTIDDMPFAARNVARNS